MLEKIVWSIFSQPRPALCFLTSFGNSGKNLDEIAAIEIPHNPPWLNPKTVFIYDLRKHRKSDTNQLITQQHFAEIKYCYPDHSAIYTDGSNLAMKIVPSKELRRHTSTNLLSALIICHAFFLLKTSKLKTLIFFKVF